MAIVMAGAPPAVQAVPVTIAYTTDNAMFAYGDCAVPDCSDPGTTHFPGANAGNCWLPDTNSLDLGFSAHALAFFLDNLPHPHAGNPGAF